MKILVLSLLRLGDIIQQIPLFNGLREKYPGAEIHLLLNKQFQSVEKILDGVVDQYVYFDREAIQKGLGESHYHILWSYSQVEKLVEGLNQNSYDIAFNFTHNKLSAYLLGALNISEKKGLYQEGGRFQGLSNPWLKYFNDRFSGTQPSLFLYVEILGRSFDIPVKTAAVTTRKKNKLVLLQCLTSDSKKNWSLEKFLELKCAIETGLVDYEVLVLAAPFERESLLTVFSEKDLLICDLLEARIHLHNADLLVTGDTSIKHLAAQAGTPIVEIAVGSSDATKTSAFSHQTVIVQSAAPCAPCAHSQACSQKTHLCEDDVTVVKVFSAVWAQLSGEKSAQQDLIRQLDRAVWGIFLDKNNEGTESFYGAVVQDLVQDSSLDSLNSVLPSWQSQTKIYREWVNKASRALPLKEMLMTKKNFNSSDIGELIFCAQNIIKSKQDVAGYFQSFVEALLVRFNQPVQIHDRVSQALHEVEELLNIREKIAYHLQTISKEGAYYAKGIGQLSIRGFEETRESIPRDLENSEL